MPFITEMIVKKPGFYAFFIAKNTCEQKV